MAGNDNKEKLTVVAASEILDKIWKGEHVEYYNVIIEGNLDIQEMRNPFEGFVIIQSSINIQHSILHGYINFSKAIFRNNFTLSLDCRGIPHGFEMLSANFNEAQFLDLASFSGTFFSGDAFFRRTQFYEWTFFNGIYTKNTYFNDAQFGPHTIFSRSKFDGGANFEGTHFNGYSEFNDAEFKYGANFSKANFGRGVDFNEAKFIGNAYFERALFGGYINLTRAKFGNRLTFKGAKFREPNSQEYACRTAKKVLGDLGIKDDADDHFYHEMEAIRQQKGIRGRHYMVPGAIRASGGYVVEDFSKSLQTKMDKFAVLIELIKAIRARKWRKIGRFILYDIIEFIVIQKVFGYGVHPFSLFGWWLSIVIIFAIIYSAGGGLEQSDSKVWYDYLWFSIATAATPGYALYKPLDFFKFIAGIEAIIGTFMWAAFITTFARKFMK